MPNGEGAPIPGPKPTSVEYYRSPGGWLPPTGAQEYVSDVSVFRRLDLYGAPNYASVVDWIAANLNGGTAPDLYKSRNGLAIVIDGLPAVPDTAIKPESPIEEFFDNWLNPYKPRQKLYLAVILRENDQPFLHDRSRKVYALNEYENDRLEYSDDLFWPDISSSTRVQIVLLERDASDATVVAPFSVPAACIEELAPIGIFQIDKC